MLETYNIPAMLRFANQVGGEFWLKAFGIFPYRIGKMPEIKMNARLTSTGGRAFMEAGFIDLSCYLMKRNMKHYEDVIIPHELCHIIAFRIWGDTGHGKAWKYAMQEMGLNPDRLHTMQTKHMAKSRR